MGAHADAIVVVIVIVIVVAMLSASSTRSASAAAADAEVEVDSRLMVWWASSINIRQQLQRHFAVVGTKCAVVERERA